VSTTITGPIFDMEFGRSDNGTCVGFAATESGMYRSRDGGTTWELVLAERTCTAVALSPSFATDNTVITGTNLGIAVSIDEGATWQCSVLHDPPPVIASLSWSPDGDQEGRVIAATLEDGAFISSDRGRTWNRSSVGLYDPRLMSAAWQNARSVFIAAESGMFRSRNCGESRDDLDLPDRDAAPTCVACHGNVTLVATEESGLFQSTDGGENWNRLDEASSLGPIQFIYLYETGGGSTRAVCINEDAVSIFELLADRWLMCATFPATNVTAAALVESPPRLVLAVDNQESIRMVEIG
jgi:photosystem II stability/assembly factor-like uncharacterized protein